MDKEEKKIVKKETKKKTEKARIIKGDVVKKAEKVKKNKVSKKKKIDRKLVGKVVSIKMDKTVVVYVERMKEHSFYKKLMRISKRIKAHSEKKVVLGETVEIKQIRPISKDICWEVSKVN
jgi:small subunit ribosomal protein S17